MWITQLFRINKIKLFVMDTLEGFPHVYCFTLPHRNKRHVYMESQFKKYNIEYSMVVMEDSKLLKKLSPNHSELACTPCLAYNCSILDTLKTWYLETEDDHVIIMEDDYDLNLIDLWGFSWKDLLDHLPYDWDCIQLGFECGFKVKFYLHPISPEYSIGPSLLNRDYVEKLLSLFSEGDLYSFKKTIANAYYLDRDSGIGDGKYFIDLAGTPDYFIGQSGRTYSLPLIPSNPLLEGTSHKGEWHPMWTFIFCYEAYYEWWTNDRHKFSLEEIFTYGKDTDILMERDISQWDSKYFEDKYNELRLI